MELVPAVTRHFKLVSTWLVIATGTLDILYAALESLRNIIDPHWFAVINVCLLAAIKIATLIKQNIPVTVEQKEALVETAQNTPIKT